MELRILIASCTCIKLLCFLQIASPSIESFSTLPDQEDLEFSLDADAGDLQVRVDNPQKHLDTLETYVTFRICTRVNLVMLQFVIFLFMKLHLL